MSEDKTHNHLAKKDVLRIYQQNSRAVSKSIVSCEDKSDQTIQQSFSSISWIPEQFCGS